MPLSAGTTLGRYKIDSPLGAGGMGEVYLAEDSKLGRRIALKILPENATQNDDTLRRFEQEARAASALNHPNIAHIYEIGEAEGINFIAMEFVEGASLDEKIAGRHLPVFDIVNIGAQIADALDEAHTRGIVHRDIKSQNVMIDQRGRVKVLDFGLAKMTEPPTSEGGSNVGNEDATKIKTKAGMVMGTVSYMSPEQALGRETDARTDIWSFGVVLYEMATGRLPFQADSLTETIDKIAHAQPEAMARFNYEIPPELELIIKKALRKKREERYQTARDIFVDLENLRREVSEPPAPTSRLTQQSEPSANISDSQIQPPATAGGSDTAQQIRTTSSAEYIVGEIKRHKTSAIIVSAVLLIIIAGLGYWFIQNRNQKTHKARLPFQNRKVTRIAVNGAATDVVISPDGKYVAYIAEDEQSNTSLWVKQATIATSNVQIIAPGAGDFGGITFSPDSQFLYYVRKNPNERFFILYQVPALGGDSRKLTSDVDSPICFSPDGKQIAFIRNNQTPGESAIFTANLDGSGERKLAMRKQPHLFRGVPAWSPDGKIIASSAEDYDGSQVDRYAVTIDVGTGAEKRLIAQRLNAVGKIAWLADGSGLVMRAAENVSEFFAQPLWFISYPGGEMRRITSDLNNYSTVSLTKDSRTLATLIEENKSAVWLLPDGDSNRARQISTNPTNLDGHDGLSWTPDGRLVFHSHVSGQDAVWIMNADGTNRKQLTDDSSANYSAVASPDGRNIFFVTERVGGDALWQMEIDGSNQKAASRGLPGAFTPDGKWFVYESHVGGGSHIEKISIDGGEPVRLTEEKEVRATRPTISPDGKLIACHYKEPEKPWKVAFIPIEGGKPSKFLDVPQTSATNLTFPGFLWTPDKRALTFRDGTMNLWLLPLDGSSPRQLTNFNSETIFWYDWSTDGKTLALSRGSITKDVVLMSEE
ncbi:MAG TPA: protein kinase [Pyrinomonadaceae bacterium]|nr:protein kinase [Pyrinomonadaceae bacterium]